MTDGAEPMHLPETPGPFLAVEASADFGSVALERPGQQVVERVLVERRRHAALTVPLIRELMSDAGVRPGELAGVVVGRGPGSFTGVRIAAATARGLALALDCPIWPLSSVLAAGVSDSTRLPDEVRTAGRILGGWDSDPEVLSLAGRPRLVLLDARADRLWGACLTVDGTEARVHLPPTSLRLGDVAGLDLPPGTVVSGSGALRHRSALEAAGLDVVPWPLGLPTAGALLRLWHLLPESRSIPAGGAWSPDYLRPTQPEREAAEQGVEGKAEPEAGHGSVQ